MTVERVGSNQRLTSASMLAVQKSKYDAILAADQCIEEMPMTRRIDLDSLSEPQIPQIESRETRFIGICMVNGVTFSTLRSYLMLLHITNLAVADPSIDVRDVTML